MQRVPFNLPEPSRVLFFALFFFRWRNEPSGRGCRSAECSWAASARTPRSLAWSLAAPGAGRLRGSEPELPRGARTWWAAMEAASSRDHRSSFQDESEDRSVFKDCSKIGFYRRQKLQKKNTYRALLDSLTSDKESTKFQIINEVNKVHLLAELYEVEENIFRFKINEKAPLKPRYEVPDVLVEKQVTKSLTLSSEEPDTAVLKDESGYMKFHITANPFQIDVSSDEEPVLSINSRGHLYFEHLQVPPKHRSSISEASKSSCKEDQDDLGLWEEKFDKFVDIKANGPTSIGLDFSLQGFEHLYGIPQHAENHLLKNTGDNEAYRLYNLDVYGYKLHSKLGIYGSIPYLLAHKLDRTIGIFWLNASETLVEINTHPSLDQAVSPKGLVMAKQKVKAQSDVCWMSESGIIDVFLLMGPTPAAVFTQYSKLTGTQALPPLFSLGYHQSRWNYNDEQDVRTVDAGFDDHDIPYDVIWLDIEHTEGKRYFTWNKKNFPTPKKMQELIQSKKRKVVVISDPHIKVDLKYSLYSQAKAKGYFVKNNKGRDFEGICWPGVSSYLDFTNPKVREWYSSLFAFSEYHDSTDILFIWNDMNEPSVFKAPEKTMEKNAVHYGNWEHRDLHNLYGFYQQMATAEGLIQRSKGEERPFVLTRSFFAGSQKYGAVWTGDNVSEWAYLKISISMLLTLNVTGISFCGADVGGFIGDPEPELLVRWYQAGAYQPFFRGHATMKTKRREPWLFGEKYTKLIREAIKERYALLPYWYSLFYNAHVASEPVMRPLWVEFPKELSTFGVENEYMLGSALLIHPVTEPKVSKVDMFLPGSKEIWYDFRTFNHWDGAQTLKIPVTLDSIPVFQRGGSVVPMKTGVGKSTGWMTNLPYKLSIALDSKGSASGKLYLDDGHSFQYHQKKQFLHRKFLFSNGVLQSRCADENGLYHSDCMVEKVLILGFKKQPSSVTVHSSGMEKKVTFTYSSKTAILLLEKLSLNISTDWEIHVK
ncbi:neutral alpha-glucosidase C-like [Macrotis lagotis]|uniref:neutral alpha-glucosidase C-like n=1 Tax=Macrotis lagotis TaxID=92651 RepID=UPI003D6941AC